MSKDDKKEKPLTKAIQRKWTSSVVQSCFSFFHLQNSVITVFSNKAQEVDAPRVHQLIVGSPCHSAGCLGNTGYHTLAVHLLTHSGGKQISKSSAATGFQWQPSGLSQDHPTWWVTKECNLTSALSRTSFHTSSPYDSLMKSWRLSHSRPYISSVWLETQAQVPTLLPKGNCKQSGVRGGGVGGQERIYSDNKKKSHTANDCLFPGVNLLEAGSWTPCSGPGPCRAWLAFELSAVSQRDPN